MIQKVNPITIPVAEELLSIQLLSYRVEAKIIGFDGIPPLSETVESIINSYDTVYGYYHCNKVVGFISFMYKERELDIHKLVVHPGCFRRGYGMKLIQCVLKLYPEMNICRVMTGEGNNPAISLYKKVGFREVQHYEVGSVTIIELEKEFTQTDF